MALLKGLLTVFFLLQMNSSYAMLGVKLYLANVQGKILNDLTVFHTSGHSFNIKCIRSVKDTRKYNCKPEVTRVHPC